MKKTLETYMHLHTPILWCTTDEPLRVSDAIAESSDRPVYRMDVLEGLLLFREDRWVQVLSETETDENGLPVPVMDLSEAMKTVLTQRGVMILENAHTKTEALLAFFNHISEKWHRAFYADDVDTMPPSLILLCHDESKIPGELRRQIVRLEIPLPSEEELAKITKRIYRHAGIAKPNRNTLRRITRAGAGLSEFEFSHSMSESLTTHKKIDPEFLAEKKIHTIASGGVLTMRVPRLTMADLGGLDEAKNLMERVMWIWKNPEEAKRLNVEPLRRILLVGVPGSGKSAFCEAGASALGLELAKFGTSSMMSKWVGESEANMRRAFTQVRAMAPLCLWIDELGRDLSGGQSSGEVDGGTTDRVHGEFLQGLQELPEGVFLVAAANRIDGLPAEMLRADRFDKIMFIGFPTEQERSEIFRIHLGSDASEVDIAALAKATEFFTGAEIKALVRETRFTISAHLYRRPTTEEFILVAGALKGRVWVNHKEQVLTMYRRAKSEWDWASSSQQAEADHVLGAQRRTAPAPDRNAERVIGSVIEGGNVFGQL